MMSKNEQNEHAFILKIPAVNSSWEENMTDETAYQAAIHR